MSLPWTDDELEALRMYYPHHGMGWDQWEYILPGRNERAIVAKANRMGLKLEKRHNAWKEWELEALKEYYPEHGFRWQGWREILPERSAASIRNRASAMGLYVEAKHATNFTEGQKRFILKSVLKIAESLHANPRAVAIEVANLRDKYDRENQ